jgi:tetratricopeptide (TPR) repeat protein
MIEKTNESLETDLKSLLPRETEVLKCFLTHAEDEDGNIRTYKTLAAKMAKPITHDNFRTQMSHIFKKLNIKHKNNIGLQNLLLRKYQENKDTFNNILGMDSNYDPTDNSKSQISATQLKEELLDISFDTYQEKHWVGREKEINNLLASIKDTSEYYQQAAESYQKIENRTSEAHTLNILGNIYSSLEEYETAIEYYEKSLSIYEQTENYDNGELVNINLNHAFKKFQETGI